MDITKRMSLNEHDNVFTGCRRVVTDLALSLSFVQARSNITVQIISTDITEQ